MEVLNYIIGIFDKLALLALILHFMSFIFAMRFFRLIFKNKFPKLWTLSLFIPPLAPLASYYTAIQATHFFRKRKIKPNLDFGLIHSLLLILSLLVGFVGLFRFCLLETATFDDFNEFAITIVACYFIGVFSSIASITTYWSLANDIKKWKTARSSKKALSAG